MNTGYGKKLPQEWSLVTSVFAALGEPTRQQIIMLFEPGEELAIKDVAAQFDLGRTTVVHHLNVLHSTGVLSMRRHGRETLYSVAYDSVLEAIRKMQLFIERNIWAELGATARVERRMDEAESAVGGSGERAAAEDELISKELADFYLDDLHIEEETPLLFVRDEDGAERGGK